MALKYVQEYRDGDLARVFLETIIGGSRIVDMLAGDQLLRIC